ncbi:hypothetical protein XENOCAPTIV_027997 [Xenoophorus captivus]|uniref:Uncharacterized protein n=1 Tax=Xenoophorus captivus TaxID=1517983 RepID=A0ABV0S9M5_9TELE
MLGDTKWDTAVQDCATSNNPVFLWSDEGAHRDVCVCHPGLVALEAVFVYPGLGQLPNLAGADLLVVPVLSVRHGSIWPAETGWERYENTSSSSPWSPSDHCSERLTPRIIGEAFLPFRPGARLLTRRRGAASWTAGAGKHAGNAADLLQNKIPQQVALLVSFLLFEVVFQYKRCLLL